MRLSEGKKLTDAQRRTLGILESMGPLLVASIRKPTFEKLFALGFVSTHQHHPLGSVEAEITDAGRKYLARWRKAYGSPRPGDAEIIRGHA